MTWKLMHHAMLRAVIIWAVANLLLIAFLSALFAVQSALSERLRRRRRGHGGPIVPISGR